MSNCPSQTKRTTSMRFNKDDSAGPSTNSTLSSTPAWAQNFLKSHIFCQQPKTLPGNWSIRLAFFQSINLPMFSHRQSWGKRGRSSENADVENCSGTGNLQWNPHFPIWFGFGAWMSKEFRASTSGAAIILEFPRARVNSCMRADKDGGWGERFHLEIPEGRMERWGVAGTIR